MIHANNILLHTLTFKNLSMLKKLFANVVKLFHLESIIKLQTLKDILRKLNGLRYSQHLIHFFSLLSESSKEYEIFKKAFSGLSIQRIR